MLEDGAITHPKSGTPQGGVISPLLANIYLHVVLDQWFERDVLPRLQGRAQLIRYADGCAPRRRVKEATMEVNAAMLCKK